MFTRVHPLSGAWSTLGASYIYIPAVPCSLLYCIGHLPAGAWYTFILCCVSSLLYHFGHPPSGAWSNFISTCPSSLRCCLVPPSFLWCLVYFYTHCPLFPSVLPRASPLVPCLIWFPPFLDSLLHCIGHPPSGARSIYSHLSFFPSVLSGPPPGT